MNSLANLNAMVDDHPDSSTTWQTDHGWDPPVATICTASLPDNRLHFHPSSACPRQEWDWSDNQLILASHYGSDEHDMDCKPNIMQVEALGVGAAGAGLRQYNVGLLTPATLSPSLGGSAAAQSSWSGLLNAVPLRQQMGLETSSGSCYSPSFYGGGVGAGGSGLNSYYPQHSQLMGMATDMEQRRINDILKRGMYTSGGGGGGGGGSPDFSARIGLNLGGRTYFSTEDNTTLARFHLSSKRFRPHSPSMHVPLCQAEGCKADLSIAKHYHRRHKVCEYHSKAATVVINGNTQRFCQQCSRFHALGEFDEGKRSCRKRLADHNRRRRKPQPPPSSTAPNSVVPTVDDSASKQNDNEEAKPAVSGHGADQQVTQHTKKDAAIAKPASSLEQTPSLLSAMALVPSVSLTLQNDNRTLPAANNHTTIFSSDDKEKEAAAYHENHGASAYLLNGPSLSLSNIAAAGAAVGGSDSFEPNHQSPDTSPQTFSTDVELSVPWLRAHHLQGSSSARMSMMQENLGKSSNLQADDHGSVTYSNSGVRRHANGQYMNERGRLLAEHIQSLQSQARRAAAARDHHHHQGKADQNWILEDAVAQEGQTVLSLLETGSNGNKKQHHHHHHHHNNNHSQSAFNGAAQSGEESGSIRHPLGFLQQAQHITNMNSPTDMNQEASDAALSLHCMQALRPLNENGLYTTADFMKDGFV